MSALTIIKKLSRPVDIAGQKVTEVELRPATIEDLLGAEEEVQPNLQPQKYRLALACRQMVRAGTFTGPFTTGMFKKAHPRVLGDLVAALEEADQLGEDEQPGQAQTT